MLIPYRLPTQDRYHNNKGGRLPVVVVVISDTDAIQVIAGLHFESGHDKRLWEYYRDREHLPGRNRTGVHFYRTDSFLIQKKRR